MSCIRCGGKGYTGGGWVDEYLTWPCVDCQPTPEPTLNERLRGILQEMIDLVGPCDGTDIIARARQLLESTRDTGGNR